MYFSMPNLHHYSLLSFSQKREMVLSEDMVIVQAFPNRCEMQFHATSCSNKILSKLIVTLTGNGKNKVDNNELL